MRIAVSTDHAGFQNIDKLKKLLTEMGHECVSFSPTLFDSGDDYPDFIYPAAHAVAKGDCQLGIIYGGSGQGEAIVANRVKGVRCAVYYGPAIATGPVDATGTEAQDNYEILRLSRLHNDANVLSLGTRFLAWRDIERAVRIWVETPFSCDERHIRRIKKIDSPL